jgi:preprotein translocase subunit YajC
MWHQLLLLANDPPAAEPAPGGGRTGWEFLPMIGAIAILFYFTMIRPMRRQEKEQQTLLGSLKKGDKVLTRGGILGTIVAVSETENEVTVKVDENVRLKLVKEGVLRNLSAEEAAKQPKEAKDAK